LISFVRGRVFSWEEDTLMIDLGGVGCQIFVPPAALGPGIKAGDEIFLYTYLQVREDSWLLFGFPEREQLEIFRSLISVTGVGTKLALVIINHLSAGEIVQAVLKNDTGRLSSIPGIGKKTAQRLVLELKEKFSKLPWGGGETINLEEQQTGTIAAQDAVLALTQLGYNGGEAKNAVQKAVHTAGKSTDTQELIKAALKLLGKF